MSRQVRMRVLLAVVVVAVASATTWVVSEAGALSLSLQSPLADERGAYVGSASCRKCHHDNHASWRRTYHRSMTQTASDETVLGAFDGSHHLEYMGITAHMGRTPKGGFEMRFETSGGGDRWRAEVEMTVGSRRFQQYLARDGDVLFRLPIAWDVEEGRFIHMNGAFLTPDPQRPWPGAPVDNRDYNRHVTRWNDNCIFCHNVAPNPGRGPDGRFASEVAEHGVACEACHGPGERHAAANHNPLRRYLLHGGDGRDPTVANPARLAPDRASEVCGRCHGQRISRDIDAVHRLGDRFVPGEALAHHSRPLFRETTLNGRAGVFAARFWPDGTARLTAYEYQGLLQSRCATHGDLSCGSCHSMHRSDPKGQLREPPPHDPSAAPSSDHLCTACHRDLTERAARAAHSGHAPAGPGARCVNCHMPKVVYGLVGVHRSHRVDVPAPARPWRQARPDACALCHVDRPRRWLAAQAARTWPGTVGSHTRDEPGVDTVMSLLFAGDPVERAVAAAALGEAPLLEVAAGPVGSLGRATRDRRLVLLLSTMLADDYPAVRRIAWRSLKTLLTGASGPEGGREGPQAASPGLAAWPALAAYRATDEPPQRQASVEAIRAQLAIPLAALPDPDRLAALRARAVDARIEIGE